MMLVAVDQEEQEEAMSISRCIILTFSLLYFFLENIHKKMFFLLKGISPPKAYHPNGMEFYSV